MSYVLNYILDILLILTYDTARLIKLWTALFYVMCVVGLEVQITTSMSRFLVHCSGQFWTSLHDQNVQEWKGIISFNFHY
jgi:hypothetical protein